MELFALLKLEAWYPDLNSGKAEIRPMVDVNSPCSLSSQRVIRVFVSSTFRDMQTEREELIKRIFPQLRKLRETRGAIWAEVGE